jgi:DNA (cytosine-5)-methyltransferase 1
MRYLSVFSGIEAATIAFKPLGWQPVAFAEIDPFCSALLQHHYPTVPNLGDVTKIDWHNYQGAVDFVVGGSPCQSFSFAGLRNSLSDERGNLTLEYVRLIHLINPRFSIYENVPGILNTKDNAFGCFLAGLVGADAPLVPPTELKRAWRGDRIKWSNAGVAAGPERIAAWRILDAQHWGVPQRRRRVFVVSVRAGDRIHPSQILFEPQSLRRDSQPCQKKRQAAATHAGGSPNSTICAFTCKDSGQDAGELAPTLRAMNHSASHQNGGGQVAIAIRTANTNSNGWGVSENCSHTLDRAQGQAVCSHTALRRLTPLETERLQGLPDFYTAIPYRGSIAADGLRYRAIGNSFAVPVVRWLGQRISI